MFTKANPTAKPQTGQPEGERPPFRAWIVIDGTDGGKPIWTEVTGLWPTQKGDSLTGQVRRPLRNLSTSDRPRLVIMPSKAPGKG
ncbi:hypothetical protein [Siccirubricoccus phaeus]|uniref:hypothetical protein n=1 Tax=Siccirubricoccus phaeus TaxID=2595053 RepID=UPI0011F263BE|nr:hypothetical protein [Siccirubricoccus phaeus]